MQMVRIGRYSKRCFPVISQCKSTSGQIWLIRRKYLVIGSWVPFIQRWIDRLATPMSRDNCATLLPWSLMIWHSLTFTLHLHWYSLQQSASFYAFFAHYHSQKSRATVAPGCF